MDHTTEIARLERELENLRASYAAMQRGAIYLRNFFFAVLIGALVSAVYSVATATLAGIGVSALVALMAAAIIVGCRGNWIYLAGPSGPMEGGRQANGEAYVRMTETMIRDRERRLAELSDSAG